MKACFILAALLGSAGIAAAQPADDTGAATTPAPAEPAPPPPRTAPPPPPAMPAAQDRPEGLSLGIGVGYTFSTSLETPNTVTLRARLASGLSFEPIVRILHVSDTVTPGTGGSTTTTTSEFGLGTNVIYPLWKRGRADLNLLGQISVDTVKNTPDSSAPNTNKVTTTFGIGYGVEIAFWITHHWMISLDATNPILAYSETQQNTAGAPQVKDATTTIGLINDPTVALIIHLFN